MKILCYHMFFHKKMTSALRNTGLDIHFCSSERRMDETGLIDTFYESGKSIAVPERVLNDVIIRCRFLSGINYKTAREHVRRMWFAVEDMFDRHQFELCIWNAVDCYVSDIIFRVADKRGVLALQPRRSPLYNLTRITNRSDHFKVRDVSDEEVEEAFTKLKGTFNAHYQNKNKKTFSKIVGKAAREAIKKVLFTYWKSKYKDPHSFHYNTIFPNKNAITVNSFDQLFANKYWDKTLTEIEQTAKQFDKVIFWPLCMVPESAICYVSEEGRLSDYKFVVEEILDVLPDNWCLIVKEHPSALGFRPTDHYLPFRGKENIVCSSMDIDTARLIDLADAILMNTAGSTGLESVARGKQVVTVGSSHYRMTDLVQEVSCLDDVRTWPEKFSFRKIEDSERRAFVKNYLENTVQSATWGPGDANKEDYEKRLRVTLDACIAVKESGYLPDY